ncbi:Hint domain-containing protein, partial [Acidocella sp.]|uniref:Hint domain-containing protein n=1 Tax=Acidocella sp. TaxID=50710 RepID=UPI001818C418
MSQTVTFSFTDPSGTIDTVTVTESTTATKIGRLGTGYAVNAISGSLGGVAITGEVGTGGKAQLDTVASYDNTIFTSGGSKGNVDGIDNKGLEFTAGGVEYNLYTSNGQFELYSLNSTNGVGTPLTLNSASTLTSVSCFMAGTAIRTPSGNAAVETLKAGDLVTLSDGRTAPVAWLGRQTISMVFADPLRVLPIRIRA